MDRGPPRRRRSLAIICVLWWILWATTFSVPRLLGWRGGDSLLDGFSWWLHLTYLPSNNITVRNVTFVFPAGDLFQCSAFFWAQTITPPLPSPQFKKVFPWCLYRMPARFPDFAFGPNRFNLLQLHQQSGSSGPRPTLLPVPPPHH